MEQQIANLFSKLAIDYYKEVKELLCKEDSYKKEINIKAVNLLSEFIESSIDDSYECLSVLEFYLGGMHGILPDILSPLSFLTDEASDIIMTKIKKVDEINRCLKVLRGEEVD